MTRDLLRERVLYTSGGFDDDLPLLRQATAVGCALQLDSNVMKFFHPNGFVLAQDMVEYVTDALGVLEAEAAGGLPRILNIGFHLGIVGRPGRYAAFRDIVGLLAAQRERVWLARRADIARSFAATVPVP